MTANSEEAFKKLWSFEEASVEALKKKKTNDWTTDNNNNFILWQETEKTAEDFFHIVGIQKGEGGGRAVSILQHQYM